VARAHRPVLAQSVVDLLLPALERGGVVVDATLGRGGHALRLLDAAPRAELVGLDRDAEAVEACRTDLASFGGRVRLARANFQDLAPTLERLGVAQVRGVVFDLGVSSPQMDRSERGFGYRAAGPIDMRMDASQELTGERVVNTYPVRDLERIITTYGEERFARRIARAVVQSRPLATTDELAEVIKNAVPAAARRSGGHPARRTFQALRIEVNDELGALEAGLPAAVDVLEPGGRAVVISYHSLEDRMVKRFFTEQARGCVCPPDFPVCRCAARARLRLLTRRPVSPGPEEIVSNPRSRSARLRAVERLGDQGESAA
jgi:16S rRNA (cytosine1402-N4)-methyltransferase